MDAKKKPCEKLLPFCTVLLSWAVISSNFASNLKDLQRWFCKCKLWHQHSLSGPFKKHSIAVILVFILPSEQQQAHSEEIPRAPADEDWVWRRDHPCAVPQRGTDVGRRPAGRAAHHHVLHRQNCQVRDGYPWQKSLHVEARCHRGLWWPVGSSQQVLTSPAGTKTSFVCKSRP